MDRRDFLKALGGSAIAAIVGPLVTRDDVVVELSEPESEPEPEPYVWSHGVFASYFIDDEQRRRHYSGEL